MTPQEKQAKDLQKRVEKYEKENIILLKKYNLATRLITDMSHLRRIPLSIKFAAWLMDRKGAQLSIQFKSTK